MRVRPSLTLWYGPSVHRPAWSLPFALPRARPVALSRARPVALPPARPVALPPARAVALLLLALALAGCRSDPSATAVKKGQILAVAAESEYANVIAQVGGRYVTARAIESNPATDPHEFQASPSIARLIGGAGVVVQNGLGYDAFMDKIEAASPSPSRTVIDVQHLLRLPDSTFNPHLWYAPRTMPALARALAVALSKLQPDHARYFAANARQFEAALRPWTAAMASFARRHPRTPVATTEPVGNYTLQAMGARIMTPLSLQAAVMNGVDPAPQDVTIQHELLARHRVRLLLYNQQVSDTLTDSFLAQARRAHIPVVGVNESMPAGYDYQSWMLDEVHAIVRRAS
jgi:zinc/manganese transport system substrate-binding protein